MERASELRSVEVDGEHLSLPELIAVSRFGAHVIIRESAIRAMEKSHRLVEEILSKKNPVYGINTGFGALSQHDISISDVDRLQNNLIISHAVGCSNNLPDEVVRAMLLLRANALCRGFSGIRPSIVITLIDMLNSGVIPIVPEKGSLGASGDLVPLAHMALVLLGLGEAKYKGEVLPGKKAMDMAGLPTYSLKGKEGLALINGTQCMTAIAALSLYDAKKLCLLADINTSLAMEALQGQTSAYDERVHLLRPHDGQKIVAQNIRLLLKGSKNIEESRGKRVQDAYSLRCVPQVHGAVRGAIEHIESVLSKEFNSVTDNPLLFADDGDVISGGNFHGEPIALCCDYLAIAVSELGSISERRLERMVNPQLSNGLPPFLAEQPGLNSGMMILQYTSASLVSDNKTLSHPDSVDSIPSSANQEDHVSMGTNAARHVSMVVDNTYNILAYEMFAAAQAVDLRGASISPALNNIMDLIREHIPFLNEDSELRLYICKIQKLLRGEMIIDTALQNCPLLK